jgi:hypothetical protein
MQAQLAALQAELDATQAALAALETLTAAAIAALTPVRADVFSGPYDGNSVSCETTVTPSDTGVQSGCSNGDVWGSCPLGSVLVAAGCFGGLGGSTFRVAAVTESLTQASCDNAIFGGNGAYNFLILQLACVRAPSIAR